MSSRASLLLALAVTIAALGAPVEAEDRPAVGTLVGMQQRVLVAANGEEIAAEGGRIVVPEVRSNPSSRRIEVGFIRLKARSSAPGVPLFYLSGGPGDCATRQARDGEALQRWLPFLERSDVVLIDQRGVGLSRPSLSLRAEQPMARDLLVSRESFVRAAADVARRATARLRAEGADLAGYTVVELADDVEDLRRALRMERIALLGFSFGTHWALAVTRQHAAHIDRVVLVGTEGLGHTRKLPSTYDSHFQALARIVAADSQAAAAIPDLEGLARRAMDQLDKEPMTVRVEEDPPYDVQVGRFGLQLVLVMDMGDARDLPTFPRLLRSIEVGDSSLFAPLIRKRWRQISSFPALFWICDGASGASPARWKRIGEEATASLFGNAMNLAFPEVNEAWGTPDLGEDFRTSARSDVPALFVSGTLDANTPSSQSEEVRAGFRRSAHVVVENAGHEQMLPDPRVQEAIHRFLRGEPVRDARIVLPPLTIAPMAGK